MEGDKIVEKVTYMDTVLGEIDNDAANTAKTPIKRGRKPKYFSEEDRRMAKREQNRKYRDRKREELIALRRLAASADNQHIKIVEACSGIAAGTKGASEDVIPIEV